MVDWDFSVETNNQKEIWEHREVKADSFNKALEKLSKKQLTQIIETMLSSQKKLDMDKKLKPTHSFEASISTRVDFGHTYIPLGVVLKSIKANSLEELFNKLVRLKLKELEKKAQKEINDQKNADMFNLPEKVKLNAFSSINLDIKEVRDLLKNKERKSIVSKKGKL